MFVGCNTSYLQKDGKVEADLSLFPASLRDKSEHFGRSKDEAELDESI